MRSIWGALFILSIVLGSNAQACRIPPQEKPYRYYTQGTHFDILDLPKTSLTDSWYSPEFKALLKFRNKVSHKTSTDPIYLLKKQQAFFKAFPDEYFKFDLIIQGQIGSIREMNCLEAFLLNNHLNGFSDETEYSAFVLEKWLSKTIKVVIYSQKKNGTVATPTIEYHINRLRRQGWRLHSLIHNHPFFFRNPYGDIAGTILPSSADFNTYKSLKNKGMKYGIVNNGFQTFVVSPSEIRHF